MKTTILFLSVALLAGCSMRDTVNIEDMTTTQAYDLSDKDSDGVVEARERCNDTVKGAGTDNYGCGQIKSINERNEINVLFPNNSAYIAPEYYPQIEEVAIFFIIGVIPNKSSENPTARQLTPARIITLIFSAEVLLLINNLPKRTPQTV